MVTDLHRRAEAPARLFCFPHAGGHAGAFGGWRRALPGRWEVCPVHLPGRIGRFDLPPFRRLAPLVAWLADELDADLRRPCAFFGHSMGALIAFELARELRRRGWPAPLRLFVSGHRAPQLDSRHAAMFDLPDDELLGELQRLNGTPADVFRDEELLSLTLPTIRADLEICETYRYEADRPLDVPISAFGGRDDSFVSPDELRAWEEQTTARAVVRLLDGDHFFVASAERQVLAFVAHDLAHCHERAR